MQKYMFFSYFTNLFYFFSPYFSHSKKHKVTEAKNSYLFIFN
ncbi:hypothetical protein HMPREF1551_02366 [Capnocytophaga sp. oral taxon 863 str. F0517]|nr:hypothetical protein HMPREF1551_02366 [Capnocytophaga sp. oral taxon 863 str. F0517]